MRPTITRASGALPDNHPLYAPGLKRRPRLGGEACYWIATAADVAKGYRPKSLTLPPELTEQEIAAQCRRLWLDLLDWRLGKQTGPTRNTIAWLIDHYLKDRESPYHGLGPRAQRSYLTNCRIITADIGERRIDPDGIRPRILGEHIRAWHRHWGNPDAAGIPTTAPRAKHLIVMLRILVSFAIELGVPGAQDLRLLLKVMRFRTMTPRTVAPTREQVMALVEKAIAAGYPSIAGVSLAQFLFIERRTHIIGMYVKQDGVHRWQPGWNWSDISPDWNITYWQTKNARTERTFDLKTVPVLLAILQGTPKDQRIGAVFKDEKTGDPWRERHFAEVFDKIKIAAGWPTELKSMDLRAGGMTEADGLEGIPDRYLQDAAGHTDPRTKDRYRRNKQRNAAEVVVLRQRAQEPSETKG